MTSSRNTKQRLRVSPGTSIIRGKTPGTWMTAILVSPDFPTSVTPRFRLRFARKGNGWLASTANGVKTGEIVLSKYLRIHSVENADKLSRQEKYNCSCSR